MVRGGTLRSNVRSPADESKLPGNDQQPTGGSTERLNIAKDPQKQTSTELGKEN